MVVLGGFGDMGGCPRWVRGPWGLSGVSEVPCGIVLGGWGTKGAVRISEVANGNGPFSITCKFYQVTIKTIKLLKLLNY